MLPIDYVEKDTNLNHVSKNRFGLNTFLQGLLRLVQQLYTFVKWAVIYCTGLFPFRWSHILTSPSCAVAKVCGDKAFQRTWDDPAVGETQRNSILVPETNI